MTETGTIVKEGEFSYQVTGEEGSEVIILLHGLMGELSNFGGLVDHFTKTHNVIFPELPIFEMPLRKLSVTGLVDYVERFIDYKGYTKVHVVGNSLGGHIAQLFVLKRPELVSSLTLTGSSGLFENAMGNTFPKRGDYEYIKRKVQDVFFDPAIASKEYVDGLYEMVNNRGKAIRIITMAKSAIRHNLADKLHGIKCPTLLVWGREDQVTPLFVGEKFNELIENSRLDIVEKCGHAPMMERPVEFNAAFESFLNSISRKESETIVASDS
ncbi:MAG: pimeloyl-ACP methyl ester carboxylesterase [Halioglobus sp.]|jgi:pimeloyl-ACP methyl ester carboxylesterase